MAASWQDGNQIVGGGGYDGRTADWSDQGRTARGHDREGSQEDRRHVGRRDDYEAGPLQQDAYYGPRYDQQQQPSTSYSPHSPAVSYSHPSYGQEPYTIDSSHQVDNHGRRADDQRLRVRDFAESSSRPEMMMRAAFVPYVAEQANEAPAPRFDPIAMMDEENEPRQYRLIIRQSPKHGQMCTLGSKNRRTLDPLPIIELDLRDKDGEQDVVGQNNPFLLMQVHLIADYIDVKGRSSSTLASTSSASDSSSTSLDGKSILPAPHEGFFAIQRLLEGKLVASAHMVWDEEAEEIGGDGKEEGASGAAASQQKKNRSCFFIFADLSIRTCGTYRLHFSLLRLGRQMANVPLKDAISASGPSSGGVVAQCTSEPFRVVHARDFAGISESTPLAKSFASQGVHIPIRNETKWRSRGRLIQDPAEHSPERPDKNGDP